MKRTIFVLVSVAVILGLTGSVATGAERYVLVMKKASVPANVTSDIEAVGGSVVRVLPAIGVVVATSDRPDFSRAAKAVSAVLEVGPAGYNALPEADLEVAEMLNSPTDQDLGYEYYQWDIRRVMAPAAWDVGATGSHATVVAVLDTGVAFNHPDLYPNFIHWDCFNSDGRWSDGVCNPYPEASWHGTHVAGTIAAAFGGSRAVGVGPNLGLAGYHIFEWVWSEATEEWRYVTFSDVRWAAMMDAADQGFEVINLSLGGLYGFGGGDSSSLAAYRAAEKRVANYMKAKGVTVVASAGNNGTSTNGWLIHLPGDVAGYINVGATVIQPAPIYPYDGAYDVRASYSNFGAAVTLAAPGGEFLGGLPYWYGYYGIYSTYVLPDVACAASWSCPVGFAWATGTSMAAPHVSGVAGLTIDSKPWLSPNQVASTLKSTAESLGDRQQFGHGMVDAYAAVTK